MYIVAREKNYQLLVCYATFNYFWAIKLIAHAFSAIGRTFDDPEGGAGFRAERVLAGGY